MWCDKCGRLGGLRENPQESPFIFSKWVPGKGGESWSSVVLGRGGIPLDKYNGFSVKVCASFREPEGQPGCEGVGSAIDFQYLPVEEVCEYQLYLKQSQHNYIVM